MKQRNRGSALIIVMCVMLVVTALSLALLRAALMLVQLPVRENQREQCRINAVSVSELVTEEIESFVYDGVPSEGEKAPANPSENLKECLEMAAAGKWEAEAKLHYQLQTDQLPGETWLEFYTKEEDSGAALYMEVGSMVGEQSCTVVNCFAPVVYDNEEASEDDVIEPEDMGRSEQEPEDMDMGRSEQKSEDMDMGRSEQKSEDMELEELTEGTAWSWKFLGRSWGKEQSDET